MKHVHVVLFAEGRDHGRRAGRAANDGALQRRKLQVARLHVGQQHLPHGGNASGKGHALVLDQVVHRFAIEGGARKHQFRTHHGGAVGNAPGIDVEHGHHGQDGIACGDAHHIGQSRSVGMQDGRAVAVQRALGVACGATGVAEARSGVFIKLGPGVLGGLALNPGFVTDQARNAGIGGQLVGIAQGHVMANGGAAAVNLFHQGQKTHVKAQHLVFCMVGNPDHLVRVQTRVDGVQHPARAAHAKVQLQVAVAVPGERGHAVAKAQAQLVQSMGDLS